jgi:excisionase family DNA binding protein
MTVASKIRPVHYNDELLNTDEMAADLGISKATLYKWTSSGRFNPPGLIRLPNRQLRITRAELRAWARGEVI